MNSATQALISEFSSHHGIEISLVEQFVSDVLMASRKGSISAKAKPISPSRSTKKSPAKVTKPSTKPPDLRSQSSAKVSSTSPKLNRSQLQSAIYEYFKVSTGTELRKSSHFQSMVKPLGALSLSKTEDLETIYRSFIGLLPHETQETGYGCINGLDIFKYSDVWTIFGLDPSSATKDLVQSAYRSLSKQYHPDMPNGDRQIFERLTQLYQAALLGV